MSGVEVLPFLLFYDTQLHHVTSTRLILTPKQVIAAVSAVVSAFHAGNELLQHVKAKRRKARAQAQQEFEEKQLQESLVSGEQQIGYRYAQDMREMGDLVRVGDSG